MAGPLTEDEQERLAELGQAAWQLIWQLEQQLEQHLKSAAVDEDEREVPDDDLRYERDTPGEALARLSELASQGYAWRRLRAVGLTSEGAARWLSTPSAWLDGQVPEQAEPEYLRSAVRAYTSNAVRDPKRDDD